MCGKEEAIQTGKYRDYLNCSRKVAIALLEQFDREGFTRNTKRKDFTKSSRKMSRR